MSPNCEKIINENEKLKLSDLEKSCVNTFEYLNLHHKVNFLRIKAISDLKEKVFFDNTNNNMRLVDSLLFKQNCDTNVIFDFFSNSEENFEEVSSHLDSIRFSLQIFSQSIFNKYMEKTIDEMSLVDHVTGAYNRCYLNNYAQTIFSLANREQKKLAFVKIAIDQFKAVIDEFDYSTGDKVLKKLSESLKHSLRDSDLVIKISNDEFLVILMNVINKENAIMISEKLINNFSQEEVIVNEINKQVLKKTICTGITIYPDDAVSLDDILKKSDIALYEAQNRGRSQVFKFTEEETHTIDFSKRCNMKNNILELIEASGSSGVKFESISKIFRLYEQLKYATNLKQIGQDIFYWLHHEFKIDNMTFTIFDINKNEKDDILIEGESFYLDDDFTNFFIVNTHTSLNATISFKAISKVHNKILQDQYHIIESAFDLISPIVQNGILKRNYVESSSIDSVTNVYNRSYLVDNLTRHLSLSKNKQTQIYFLMIGIDHFKAVIDEFDHDIGDKVLIELAKVIHTNVSQFDMVGRLTGDEFLVTMLSTEYEHEVVSLAHKIISDFAQAEILVDEKTNQTLKKTICIGLDKHLISDRESINETIKNADIALYEAKNKGRSTLFKYEDLKVEDTIDLF